VKVNSQNQLLEYKNMSINSFWEDEGINVKILKILAKKLPID
jgi:hypothetical protein